MNFQEFKRKYQLKLNDQQQKAVLATKGAILLLAVPGSGKTTVIVARMGYMIEVLKIKPEQILTLTYSVAAARDMKERFCRVFGIELASKLEFRTIHSFCVKILKEYETQTNKKVFPILSNQNEVLAKAYYTVTKEFANENMVKEMASKIAYCKNKMLSKQDIENIKIEGQSLWQIYQRYEMYKIENKVMDFDDQLLYAYKILTNYPELRKKLQNQYQYIQVDEAQDTSKLQHEIIRLLVKENIFMVGDEDQSIYQFRAAYPEALLQFKDWYKEAQVLWMETNYRSTKEILEVANKFIKQNANRTDKTIISNGKRGKPIKQVIQNTVEEQYDYVLKQIKNNKQKLAILYRNNDSSIPIIHMLSKTKIPFYSKGQDTNFFSDTILDDIKKIIAFSKDLNNIELFEKIYYKLNCGIPKKWIENSKKVEQKQTVLDILLEQQEMPLWQMKKIVNLKRECKLLQHKNSYEILRCIINEMGYKEYLQSRITDSISQHRYHQKINILYWIAKQHKKIEDFLQELDRLEEIIKMGNNQLQSNVTLSTIHASKGLEYDKVILIDVIEGVLPIVNKPEKLTSEKLKEQQTQYEEEVRLFYVGITRAKKELEIVSYQKGYESEVVLSQFGNLIFTKE